MTASTYQIASWVAEGHAKLGAGTEADIIAYVRYLCRQPGVPVVRRASRVLGVSEDWLRGFLRRRGIETARIYQMRRAA